MQINISNKSIPEIQKEIKKEYRDFKNQSDHDIVTSIGEAVFSKDISEYLSIGYENGKDIYPEGFLTSKNEDGYTGGWGDNMVTLENLDLTIEIVDGFGGEGQGDSFWGIAKISDSFGNSKLFKVDGWYASYEGAESDDYEDWQEVKAVTKTVMVYE